MQLQKMTMSYTMVYQTSKFGSKLVTAVIVIAVPNTIFKRREFINCLDPDQKGRQIKRLKYQVSFKLVTHLPIS